MKIHLKLKKIIEELQKEDVNMTQKKFIKDSNLAVSTFNKLFTESYNANTSTSIASIEAIISRCRKSDNEAVKHVTYDFLLDDSVENITRENIEINRITNFDDLTIQKIQEINKTEPYILNDIITNMDSSFWTNLQELKILKNYKTICKDIETIYSSLLQKGFNNFLKARNNLYLEYSNNESINQKIKEYTSLLNETISFIKSTDNYFAEEPLELMYLFNIDTSGKLKKLYDEILVNTYNNCVDFFIKDLNIQNKMKPTYNFDNFEEIHHLYTKLCIKYSIEKKYLIDTEEEISQNFNFDKLLKQLKFHIDNNICFTIEKWNEIIECFNIINTNQLQKKLKFELTENLILYMNKK